MFAPTLVVEMAPDDRQAAPPQPAALTHVTLHPWQHHLRQASAAFGIELTDAHLALFLLHVDALLEWNRRVNLTHIIDPDQIGTLHFLDSIACLGTARLSPESRIIDVGSGAGFPGVPIAVIRPDLHVTLLEAARKKCRFLEHLTAALKLSNVSIDWRRAEDAGRDPTMRESFDSALIRAVAHTAVCAELCLPLIRVGGMALIMKGPRGREETAAAQPAITTLGGRIVELRQYVLPLAQREVRRSIIVVRKERLTPDQYPRAPGRPAKRPLGIDRLRRRG